MNFQPVVPPEGEGWVMRPVLEGLCQFESLSDGKLDLCDIAIMNDHLDIRDENRARAQEAANRK